MADLGGYLAVSYLAEHVFTDALTAVWRVGWEQAGGEARWGADTPFGRFEATGAASLNKPAVAFRGVANAIEVHLTGAARAEVSLGGRAAGGVFIDFDSVVLCPVTVTQDKVFQKAVVDLSGFTLQAAQLRLTWFDGPHDPNGETALLGSEARAALSDEVRRRAARYLTFRLPTDQSYLVEMALTTKGNPGSVIFTPVVKLGNVRILDGWLALGIDATSGIGATQGNAAAIGPPPDPPPPGAAPMPQDDSGESSLRLLVDPGLAVAYLHANARFALMMAAATQPHLHPNLDAVGIALEDDTIVLSGSGDVDAPDPLPGKMPFTANVRIRPFIPKNTHSVYASIKPDVHVDAPWYLEVLGDIVDFFGGDSFAQLHRANKSQMAVLFGAAAMNQAVPDEFGLYASIYGCQFVVRPDLFGLIGGARVDTAFSEPDLSPSPAVLGAVQIRARHLQLQFSNRRLSVDPTFRVRYSIRRGSNGSEVASGTIWSGTGEPFGERVDLWDPGNVLETAFTVELVAERPPGVEVGHVVQSVKVLDPFDRSHPFVRWRKQHYFTGSPEPTAIQSAIHRTAIPGRCRFCDVRNGRFGTPYAYEVLDTLPAPDEQGFSSRLCSYCFPAG